MKKWLLELKNLQNTNSEEEKWEQIHAAGYHIWSVSSDEKLQKQVLLKLKGG